MLFLPLILYALLFQRLIVHADSNANATAMPNARANVNLTMYIKVQYNSDHLTASMRVDILLVGVTEKLMCLCLCTRQTQCELQ